MTDTIQKIADDLKALAIHTADHGISGWNGHDKINAIASRLRALSARASAGEGGGGDALRWVRRQIEVARKEIDRTIDSGHMTQHYAAHEALKQLRAIENALTTRPTPEAQEARDAARYRWLRQFDIGIDHQGYDDYRWYAYANPEPRNGRLGLDAVIDAALALPAQGEGNRG